MNKQKFGIVLYKETANLGDDIQTYAAYRFLPKIDYVINREELSYFTPKKKEKVKVIMNGWFNHDKTQVLPSPYIDPLMISIHYSANDLNLKSGYKFLDGYAKEVLNKYKIGCRDKHTLEQLKSMNYKNIYFSSCLTTTLDPIGKKKEEDYIVAVDMNPKIIEHLRSITNLKIIETTHWLFIDKDMTYEEKLEKIKEFDKGSTDKKNKMIEKNQKRSFEERMKRVEKQLKLYQNAKLVLTDRIHVGLPCLGLQTNVLLIYYDYNSDRIETFKELLTNCTENEFLNMKKEDLKKIKNKDVYKKYRKELIKRVKDFIEKEEEKDSLPEIEDFEERSIKREEYIKGLYQEKIKDLEEKIKELESQKTMVENYKKIINSRSWKIIGKYYKNKLQ